MNKDREVFDLTLEKNRRLVKEEEKRYHDKLQEDKLVEHGAQQEGLQKISGYRKLTATEIQDINCIKAYGVAIKNLVEGLTNSGEDYDPRWLAIGKTDLQMGFMALVRAVAKPEGF